MVSVLLIICSCVFVSLVFNLCGVGGRRMFVMLSGRVDSGLRLSLGEIGQPFGVPELVALLGDKALCRQETNTNEGNGAQMNII